ncbi:MAG: translation initiation factor IF-2, partial [Anaerolineae bacterium]|nr:translation initiation factor IF-2 [Anaerolineae bacterium]NIN95076.1 translation initiation factor IF-2 [Anaerolineae bacterium]NIQ78115.1 translation initiation factor IF-2 [Anaerolineae bacterium]
MSTVLVQSGTLRVGDALIAGLHYGKIRALISDRGTKVDEASPSTPVEVLGLSGLPEAGDSFMVVDEEWKARQIGGVRMQRQR